MFPIDHHIPEETPPEENTTKLLLEKEAAQLSAWRSLVLYTVNSSSKLTSPERYQMRNLSEYLARKEREIRECL